VKYLGLGLAFAALMAVTHAFAQPRTPPREIRLNANIRPRSKA